MTNVTQTQQLIMKAFDLFTGILFLHFYDEAKGATNEKVCTDVANAMFKYAKNQKSSHGRSLAAQEYLIKYIRSVIENAKDLGTELDREFILKTIAIDTYVYESFVFSFVHRVVQEVTTKANWSYRQVVETFAKYCFGLVEVQDRDKNAFADEAAKIMMREVSSVSYYALMKFAEKHGKESGEQEKVGV